MKKNHEKLTDAIGMLNQETIHGCVKDAPHTRRVLNGRRAVALMAACLAMILVVGAVIAVPLMKADEPSLPSVSEDEATRAETPVTENSVPATDGDHFVAIPTPPIYEGLSYHAAPLVNVQILSEKEGGDEQSPPVESETIGADVDDTPVADTSVEDVTSEMGMPEVGTSENEAAYPEYVPDNKTAVMIGDSLNDHSVYLLFYAEAGETVTVTSHNGQIGQGALPSGLETDDNWESLFAEYSIYTGLIYGKNCGKTLVVDPEFPVVTLGGNRFYPEKPLGGRADEEYVDFIIRDAEGLITGAGSVYLGNKKPVQNTESRYYDSVSITRGVVLGAVRFDEPEKVTEAQAEAFVASLHDNAETIKPTLFDNPTMTEKFIMALGDMINENYSAYDNFSMAYGYGRDDGYRAVTVTSHKIPEIGERSYLLMEDGSWAEYDRLVYACALCGELEEECCHHTVERYLLTDGRVLDDRDGKLVEPSENGVADAAEILADMIPDGSPMKEAILSAYAGLAADDAELLPAAAIHQKVNLMMGGIWNRYAILEVCLKGQTSDEPAKCYFITEDGGCFEIVKEVYPCAHCNEILESEAEVETHGGFSDYGVGYLLADGRIVTVESGWSGYTGQEQAYAPEFKNPQA